MVSSNREETVQYGGLFLTIVASATGYAAARRWLPFHWFLVLTFLLVAFVAWCAVSFVQIMGQMSIHGAVVVSVIVTLPVLIWFGFIMGRFNTHRPMRRAWQIVLVGGLAAATVFAIAKLID